MKAALLTLITSILVSPVIARTGSIPLFSFVRQHRLAGRHQPYWHRVSIKPTCLFAICFLLCLCGARARVYSLSLCVVRKSVKILKTNKKNTPPATLYVIRKTISVTVCYLALSGRSARASSIVSSSSQRCHLYLPSNPPAQKPIKHQG